MTDGAVLVKVEPVDLAESVPDAGLPRVVHQSMQLALAQQGGVL